MYNQFTCDETGAITGWSANCSVDLAAVVKGFITDADFEFTTELLAKSATQWGTDIAAKSIYPLPIFDEMDDNSEAPVEYTSPITSNKRVIRPGKGSYVYRIPYDPCLHTRLRKFNGKDIRFIEVDNNNNVIGTTSDGVVFKGLEAYIYVGEKVASTGDVPAFTPITLTYLSTLERDDQPAVFNVDWNIKGLNGVQPATVATSGTPSALEVIVDISQSCDGTAIAGLVVADFIFLQDSDGLEETISTATESPTIPGRYTLDGAAFETGTINLRDVVTVGTAYYQGTAAVVTI
jgi:hypothetical protein